jgi:cysteine-rich secretory family protein
MAFLGFDQHKGNIMIQVFPNIRKACGGRFMHNAMTSIILAGLCAAPAGAADLRSGVLAAHNAARAAVGVPPVAWSDRLAAEAAPWAQELARRGRLEHSAANDRPGEGENLWIGTAGTYGPSDMVAGWTAEKADFRPGVFPDVSASGNWQAVGHYSQMIWRNTTQIGCARASLRGWEVLVCRYAPAGNTMGESVY